jgi:23S rRNA pseudouridine1911/1915/1917 synthase
VADTRLLPVPDGLDGLRLDVAISRLMGFSRTAAADLIDAGQVTMDGASPARSAKVHGGSLLEVTLPEPVVAGPPQSVDGLTVLYDDNDVVVVDKPVGVAVHASSGWTGPTVVEGLAAMGYRLASAGPAERQGIVHRLDVGTSGLMAVAKSERAYTALKNAFRARTVEKTYHAVVQGLPDPLRGTIDAPIGRHPGHDYKFAVMKAGKASITHYEMLEAFRSAALMQVHLETGRTHQIRVHFAALRHPCVGDLTYGADPVLAARLGLERQWLHAVGLAFEHPGSGEWVEFTSPYPGDLDHALELLRQAPATF